LNGDAVGKEEGGNGQSGTTQLSATPAKSGQSRMEQVLAEAIAALKSDDDKKYFAIDTYVDALDQKNDWRVGRIVDIKGANIAVVAFDGWASPRWDEVYLLFRSLQALRRNIGSGRASFNLSGSTR
jgi:hypothetical protein